MSAAVMARRVGGNMIRFSVTYFYDLGTNLFPLNTIQAGTKLRDAWIVYWRAESELATLLNTSWFVSAIRTSYGPGQKLLAAIKAITQRSDFEQDINFVEIANVTTALNEFQTTLRAELQIADAYYVSPKGGFDTSVLIGSAENLFPQELGRKVPLSIPDVREAGKCLAFELPTASGFHALRANEAVLRAYWSAVTNGLPQPKNKNIGLYIKKMQEMNVGKPKVIACLTQIKDLHRNPLMHPEESLTVEEAVGLLGIIRSAITAMLAEIPDAPLIMPPGPSSLPQP